MTSSVGNLIKAWRKAKKLTGENLARQAGINRTTLSRWEAGRTQPRMTELEAVLFALEVSPMQRLEALAQMEAPRAIKLLREGTGEAYAVRGDLLRTMRLRQGWTQQETATQMGIAQGTLARWERTEDWPSVERLHLLCNVLHAKDSEWVALSCGFVSTQILEL